jgi:hypothetical protein
MTGGDLCSCERNLACVWFGALVVETIYPFHLTPLVWPFGSGTS